MVQNTATPGRTPRPAPPIRRPWLTATAIILVVAALMAAPNIISSALPPVHETAATKELVLGEDTADGWRLDMGGVTCRDVPLKMIPTYDCGGSEISTSVIDTTDDPNLALQRMMRAVESSKLPTVTPQRYGNVRVLTLDREQARQFAMYGVDEGQQITGASLVRGDRTLVAIVIGSSSVANDVVRRLQEAQEQ